ncbi:hypothetical protein [Streptomyces sp. OE57]|uniref:hypothetical protein n=1 Tax=Streptomyces lacaronensis TaxID=3379885 RepID=UPI0039B78DC5
MAAVEGTGRPSNERDEQFLQTQLSRVFRQVVGLFDEFDGPVRGRLTSITDVPMLRAPRLVETGTARKPKVLAPASAFVSVGRQPEFIQEVAPRISEVP